MPYTDSVKSALGRFYLFRGLGLTWLYVPFQWFYLRGQGLSAMELMGLNTVFCVAAVMLEVPTGALADRLGRRPVLASGAAFSALSCLVFLSFPTAMAWLVVANVLAALAMTCISGADSAYLFDLLRWHDQIDRYRSAESGSSAIKLFTSALGGLTAAAMVSRGMDLSALYFVTGLLTGSASLLALTLPEPWRDDARATVRPRDLVKKAVSTSEGTLAKRGAATLVELLQEAVVHVRRAFQLLSGQRDLMALLVFSAVLFPVLRVGLFLDQPFVQQLGFATSSLGLVFAAKDLVAACASALTAALLVRFGEFKLLVALPVATALALALMALGSGPAAVALVVLPTIAFGIYSPLVRVYVNRRLNGCRDRATVLSTEGMARRFGFALFSPLVGAAIDLWSLSAALAASAVWAAICLILVFLLPLRRRFSPDTQLG